MRPASGLSRGQGDDVDGVDLVVEAAARQLRLELPGLDLVEVHGGVLVERDVSLVVVLEEGVGAHLLQAETETMLTSPLIIFRNFLEERQKMSVSSKELASSNRQYMI